MIDGTIKNADIVQWGERSIVIGRLYGDRKQRWEDGTSIRTSFIVEGPDADGIVKTRNSVYRLEMRA